MNYTREIERGLRQPRPVTNTSASWWLSKDRDALNREAEERSIAMSASKQALKVSGVRGIVVP
jgi:hypothetical protein